MPIDPKKINIHSIQSEDADIAETFEMKSQIVRRDQREVMAQKREESASRKYAFVLIIVIMLLGFAFSFVFMMKQKQFSFSTTVQTLNSQVTASLDGLLKKLAKDGSIRAGEDIALLLPLDEKGRELYEENKKIQDLQQKLKKIRSKHEKFQKKYGKQIKKASLSFYQYKKKHGKSAKKQFRKESPKMYAYLRQMLGYKNSLQKLKAQLETLQSADEQWLEYQ